MIAPVINMNIFRNRCGRHKGLQHCTEYNMRVAGVLVPILLALTVISGCTANYGNISRQSDSENAVGLLDLADNWRAHDIYYATRHSSRPAAVMFDPKGDGKRLVGKSWYRIQDPVTLAKTIRTIQIWYRTAAVGVIRGPDNRLFGYMYTSPGLNIVVKLLDPDDPDTLYVSTLPRPKSGP